MGIKWPLVGPLFRALLRFKEQRVNRRLDKRAGPSLPPGKDSLQVTVAHGLVTYTMPFDPPDGEYVVTLRAGERIAVPQDANRVQIVRGKRARPWQPTTRTN